MMRNLFFSILVCVIVTGSLQAQPLGFIDANGWYSTDCVGSQLYIHVGKQGSALRRWSYPLTPSQVLTGNNSSAAVSSGTGVWANYYNFPCSTLTYNGTTISCNVYIDKSYATTGVLNKAYFVWNGYMVTELEIENMGPKRISGQDYDAYSYASVVLADSASVETLVETNGAGTGGGTACSLCGILGCDGSCVDPPDLPVVEVNLEGVVQLLQHLITLMGITNTLLQGQNGLLTEILSKVDNPVEMVRSSYMLECLVGLLSFFGGVILFGILVLGMRSR
jgi:hypothetical protein